MGTTSTTNYNLIKPNPFEEEDTWGPILNQNWDKVDAQMKVNADAIATKASLTAANVFTQPQTMPSIELGNADTTITRSSSGVIAVEGGVVPKENRANTFTANQIISVTDNTNAALRVTQLGTGLALCIEDSTNPDASPFVVDAGGNVGIGTATPAYALDVRSTAGITEFTSGAGDGGQLNLSAQNSASAAAVIGYIKGSLTNGNAASFSGDLLIGTANSAAYAARLKISSAGDVLAVSSGGLGYGTGSGGTVTQATSKSTGVTLNKTNGEINMHNAALAAGASVEFAVTNSTVVYSDTVVINASFTSYTGYRVEVRNVYNSGFAVRVTNVTAGSLSEAVQLHFSVIKAVIS